MTRAEAKAVWRSNCMAGRTWTFISKTSKFCNRQIEGKSAYERSTLDFDPYPCGSKPADRVLRFDA
jgi:hypothetical protein